uniref:RING-type domain-containing protein n=1 Tax=Hanusia phi TaxID=3032 RepID=A0A7S0HQT2_9CRYP
MLARSKPATLLRVFLVCFVRCSTASLSSTFKLRSSSYASPSALSFFQIQPLFVDVGNSTRFYFNMKLGVSDSFPNFEQARIMFMGPSQTSSIITWISSTRSLAGSPNQFAASSWFEATDEGGPWVVDKLVLYDTSANGWLYTRKALAQMGDRVNMSVYVWTEYMSNCSTAKNTPCTASGGRCVDRQLVEGLEPMSLCSCPEQNFQSDGQLCSDMQQQPYSHQVNPTSSLPQDMIPHSSSGPATPGWNQDQNRNSSSAGYGTSTALRLDESPPASSVTSLLQLLGLSAVILFLMYGIYMTSSRLQAIKQIFFPRRLPRVVRHSFDSFAHAELSRPPRRQRTTLPTYRRAGSWTEADRSNNVRLEMSSAPLPRRRLSDIDLRLTQDLLPPAPPPPISLPAHLLPGAVPPRSTEDLSAECCICFEEREQARLLPCGHSEICYGCAEHIKKSAGSCPVCRVKIVSVARVSSRIR